MGSPSPHQNQSWRRQSMVRFESTTSLTYPPSKTMKAMPRFDPVITVLSTVTCRMQFMFPSQNFNALEAEESRQFVAVMFSQGSAGPQILDDHNTMASSPVSMVLFEMCTSLHPSGSMPSAHTASFKLDWT